MHNDIRRHLSTPPGLHVVLDTHTHTETHTDHSIAEEGSTQLGGFEQLNSPRLADTTPAHNHIKPSGTTETKLEHGGQQRRVASSPPQSIQ